MKGTSLISESYYEVLKICGSVLVSSGNSATANLRIISYLADNGPITSICAYLSQCRQGISISPGNSFGAIRFIRLMVQLWSRFGISISLLRLLISYPSFSPAVFTSPNMYNSTTAYLVVFAVLYVLWRYAKGTRHPPGPFRWPIVGNAFQIPTEIPWRQYAEWGKQYGSCCSFFRTRYLVNRRRRGLSSCFWSLHSGTQFFGGYHRLV